jgi:hypothetical protein
MGEVGGGKEVRCEGEGAVGKLIIVVRFGAISILMVAWYEIRSLL